MVSKIKRVKDSQSGPTLTTYCMSSVILLLPLFVINTSRSFPHSWLITRFVARLIRRVPLVEQELLTLPEHLSSPSSVNNRKTVKTVMTLTSGTYSWSFVTQILYAMYFFRTKRLRKAFGGGIRQGGVLAAAALYALDNVSLYFWIKTENLLVLGQRTCAHWEDWSFVTLLIFSLFSKFLIMLLIRWSLI
jgi:hypothetical protein